MSIRLDSSRKITAVKSFLVQTQIPQARICMQIHMSYIHIHAHAHIHMHIHIYIYICMHILMHAYARTHTDTCQKLKTMCASPATGDTGVCDIFHCAGTHRALVGRSPMQLIDVCVLHLRWTLSWRAPQGSDYVSHYMD